MTAVTASFSKLEVPIISLSSLLSGTTRMSSLVLEQESAPQAKIAIRKEGTDNTLFIDIPNICLNTHRFDKAGKETAGSAKL